VADQGQWRDEVENMDISVAVPNALMDVSNGSSKGRPILATVTLAGDWHVHYPISNYDVSMNIGNYVHFSDQFGDLPLARREMNGKATQRDMIINPISTGNGMPRMSLSEAAKDRSGDGFKNASSCARMQRLRQDPTFKGRACVFLIQSNGGER
jgi:hypothetical protein